MENKRKTVLSLIAIILACCLIFFGSAYLYLVYDRNRASSRTEIKNSSVPYLAALPENAGLLFSFPDDSAALFYLDFTAKRLTVVPIDDRVTASTSYYGYPVTYTVKAGYPLITGIIDRVGGIELDLGEGILRYTGVQVTALLSVDADAAAMRCAVLQAVISKISVSGLTRQDFVYIIGNSETDLTVPDCYPWPEHLPALCKNANFLGNE